MFRRLAIAALVGTNAADAASAPDLVSMWTAPVGHAEPVAASQPESAPGSATADVASAPVAIAKLDPSSFFDQIVDRYRALDSYHDSVKLVQTIEREGQNDSRVESDLICDVDSGQLLVKTPASQARSALGLDLPIKRSESARDAERRYWLWLAPHMALKFTDRPLKEFRAGVDEGFTATQAERVVIDNKKMVHVALRSGDGLSEDCAARFDLFIDPESMLIERIEGQQRLPDGASFTTTLHITPDLSDSGPADREPAA